MNHFNVTSSSVADYCCSKESQYANNVNNSDVGDFNTLVRVHGAACSPRDGLNSGLSGQRAAAALEALASLHKLAVPAEPQRTLEKENTTTNQYLLFEKVQHRLKISSILVFVIFSSTDLLYKCGSY